MYDASPNYGALIFYAGLREEAKNESGWAIDSFKQEVEKILKSPISDKELNRAKSSVLGSEVNSAERLQSVAMEETIRELYGLGYQAYLDKRAAIEKVTAKDVNEMAKKYLNDHNFMVHVLGSEEIVPKK
jgi:zinc protease